MQTRTPKISWSGRTAKAKRSLRAASNWWTTRSSSQRTGLYFVYSQASFRVSCSDEDADDVKDGQMKLSSVSHRIWRYSDSRGVKESLMSAVRSACQVAPTPIAPTQDYASRDGQGWYNAIYLGAVFKLRQRRQTVDGDQHVLGAGDRGRQDLLRCVCTLKWLHRLYLLFIFLVM